MLRLTSRDDGIMTDIQEVGDGALGRRHLMELHFSSAGLRAHQKSMQRLYEAEYVWRETVYSNRVSAKKSAEVIYGLAWRGALRVAALKGIEVEEPKGSNENQQRSLERRLREKDFPWLRRCPSIVHLEHRFAVIDLHLKLRRDLAQLPSVSMDWLPESFFKSPTVDKVEFTVKGKDGKWEKKERGVVPDAFCLLVDHERKKRGELYKLNLLIEMDMGTHAVRSRFATTKAAPYAAYIGSPAFRARFDADVADWLIVTSGERRMRNLIKHTQRMAGEGARWFLFSSWDQLRKGNALTTPLWWRPRSGGGPKKWVLLPAKE
jgi:hypothetical protein